MAVEAGVEVEAKTQAEAKARVEVGAGARAEDEVSVGATEHPLKQALDTYLVAHHALFRGHRRPIHAVVVDH